MSVTLPIVPSLTQEVTDLNDCLLSKSQAKFSVGKYFSLTIFIILLRVVDFPWPHSPKTKAVHGCKTYPLDETK